MATNYCFLSCNVPTNCYIRKNEARAANYKPATKNNNQNNMDTVAGKFIYRYGQRNALPGNAAFS